MFKNILVRKPLTQLVTWFKNLFTAEYELTIWMNIETTNGDGAVIVTRDKQIFKLSKITKKSAKHFVGKDLGNNFFEIKTNTVMDYKIVRIH
jgi:hypothetical protein|tara:strand:- start:2422 stop:2697 length:276 start_codon:yes stop_codon:yes gene_type:complete